MSENYSHLRTTHRLNLGDSVPLPGPLAAYLEVTNICNFKCVFCPESFSNYEERAGGLFKSEDAAVFGVLDQMAALGTISTLNFYMMGEPFVHKSLPQFVRYAKKVGAARRLIVTSNGTLLLPRVFQQIVDSGLDYLRISIYGGTEETHRQRTQNNTPLSRIRDNVEAFRKYRDSLGVSTPFIYAKMIQSPDEDENTCFRQMFADIADEVSIEPVMNWNDPTEGNLAGIAQEKMLEGQYFANRKKACPFPFYTTVVHSDLKVSVCCVDWSKQLVIGDLKTQTLAEVWRGEPLRAIQVAHLDGRRCDVAGCATCTYIHTAPDNIDSLTSAEYLHRIHARSASGS